VAHLAESPWVSRRELIAVVLGIVCTPFTVAAQQTSKVYRIGWLDYSSSGENLGIFVQAMGARGWVDGRTFRIEYRGADGRVEQLSAVAAELVRLPAELILAPGTLEALAVKKATNSIPIVMTGVDDPVESGLVESLARPGGNITGVANVRRELTEKLLSLLREVFPSASSVAVLWDATYRDHLAILGHLQNAARRLGVSLHSVPVHRHTEVEPAFAAIKKQGSPVLIVPLSSMLVPGWIADLALKHRLPLASTSPGYVYEGGLIAYTDDWNAVFDRAAAFVDRILKGAKPADLPVERPTRFKLIVNMKTAQTLGLVIPPAIMLRADDIIK
jgi:putative tryptophan/tyrosine transport system substrate-binding protein